MNKKINQPVLEALIAMRDDPSIKAVCNSQLWAKMVNAIKTAEEDKNLAVAIIELTEAARQLSATAKLLRKKYLYTTGKASAKKPVTIRGVTYSCSVEAAAALGVTPGYIRTAARRGTLENVGIPYNQSAPNSIPVTVDGVTYASKAEAARALNLPYHKL